MKRLLGFIVMLLVFGCDDGDITFKTFNFSNSQLQSCNDNFIYAIQGTEVLILYIDKSNFSRQVTSNDEPKIVQINSSTRVVYRNYDGNINSNTICTSLPPSSPSVIEESNAAPGGTIQIITTENKKDNVVIGYNHQIRLVNTSFINGKNTLKLTNTVIGTYTTPLGYLFDFDKEGLIVESCDSSKIFKKNLNEALIIAVNPELFKDEETPEGNPRIQELDAENQVVFNVYSGNIIKNNICATIPPLTPTITEQWKAATQNSGSIEVTTIWDNTANIYRHEIRLIDVIFTNNGNNTETFTTGENYLFGTYTK